MRTKIINFRLSDEENKSLNFKSNLANMKVSIYIRAAIDNSIVIQQDKDFKNKILFLMNNATNNINQIAKYCNTNKKLDNSVLKKLEDNLNYLKAISEAKEQVS